MEPFPKRWPHRQTRVKCLSSQKVANFSSAVTFMSDFQRMFNWVGLDHYDVNKKCLSADGMGKSLTNTFGKKIQTEFCLIFHKAAASTVCSTFDLVWLWFVIVCLCVWVSSDRREERWKDWKRFLEFCSRDWLFFCLFLRIFDATIEPWIELLILQVAQ